MIKIDRMTIDDAGGNPHRLALSVLNQIPDLKPPIPVREIAYSVDIHEIKEEKNIGIEGALVTKDDKSGGLILLNSERHETRKRFTIGHELGHYLSPWHRSTSPNGFRCGSQDMTAETFESSDRAKRMEVEANQFSAELLMPSRLINDYLKRHPGLDITHIVDISERYKVSRESAGRRYVSIHTEPAALVFSKDGIVRYVKKSQFFPSLRSWNRTPLPEKSISKRLKMSPGNISGWEQVDSDEWLSGRSKRQLIEQTMSQSSGFQVTLLTFEEDDHYDDDKENEPWSPPTFHR
ncbi:MAG: ImmA/IrrE family metallo-endopeptidase [Alphaproteobacteria bacterium]|nr:ImmA/IrrE family metallo-endopeptidase [Alphaproteobacteria bacterium]